MERILDSFEWVGVFSRAVEGRTYGSRSGKTSEAHSATDCYQRTVIIAINRQVRMLKAWVRAAQRPKGLAETGRGPPCFCLPLRVEMSRRMKGSSCTCSPFQVEPFFASIILFVGRAWDAFTDPLVGFCISKSSWTRLGRLMPW